jgi:hypothetical protein
MRKETKPVYAASIHKRNFEMNSFSSETDSKRKNGFQKMTPGCLTACGGWSQQPLERTPKEMELSYCQLHYQLAKTALIDARFIILLERVKACHTIRLANCALSLKFCCSI